jgi:hypothetical protein
MFIAHDKNLASIAGLCKVRGWQVQLHRIA